MHGFVRDLITEWRRLELPSAGETVVVGVSGGADSVSLLLAIHELTKLGKLDLRIIAAHFNHGLRQGDSDADEEFVRALTSERVIEFAVGRTHERLDSSGNLEQNARNARYAFLRKTAANLNADAVLTGHTVNDQAETFLINLIRGSGPAGLCGIRPVRSLEDRTPAKPDGCEVEDEPFLFPAGPLLVRPLVTWAKRRDTEGYCHSLGVEYRYDTMNEDTAYKRVRIRKILLPMLEDFNPNIVEILANTAGHMQRSVETTAVKNRNPAADELLIEDLRGQDAASRIEVIRDWIGARRGTQRQLGLKHIEGVERLALSTKSGRVAEMPGGRVVKRGGRLIYEEN